MRVLRLLLIALAIWVAAWTSFGLISLSNDPFVLALGGVLVIVVLAAIPPVRRRLVRWMIRGRGRPQSVSRNP